MAHIGLHELCCLCFICQPMVSYWWPSWQVQGNSWALVNVYIAMERSSNFKGTTYCYDIKPLVNSHITIENNNSEWENSLFFLCPCSICCVKLPEGIKLKNDWSFRFPTCKFKEKQQHIVSLCIPLISHYISRIHHCSELAVSCWFWCTLLVAGTLIWDDGRPET